MAQSTGKEFFCVECKSFLPEARFNKNGGRTLCSFHDNKKRDTTRKSCPIAKKVKTMWHVAYNDAVRKFNNRSNISFAQTKEILSKFNIPQEQEVRLLPCNPLFPVSSNNFCLTSLSARKEIVSFWIRTHCIDGYNGYVGKEPKRPIYGKCFDDSK